MTPVDLAMRFGGGRLRPEEGAVDEGIQLLSPACIARRQIVSRREPPCSLVHEARQMRFAQCPQLVLERRGALERRVAEHEIGDFTQEFAQAMRKAGGRVLRKNQCAPCHAHTVARSFLTRR